MWVDSTITSMYRGAKSTHIQEQVIITRCLQHKNSKAVWVPYSMFYNVFYTGC